MKLQTLISDTLDEELSSVRLVEEFGALNDDWVNIGLDSRSQERDSSNGR